MSSYHGWTHAPKEQGGTDPIPGLGGSVLECGVAFDAGVDGTTSVNSGTLTTISFDNVFVSAGATAIAIDTAPAPGTTMPLKIIKSGWFLVGFSFKWGSSPASALYQVDPDFIGENMAADQLQTECTHAFAANTEHQWGPIYFHDFGDNTLVFKTQHAFGSSRGITAVYFTVLYLGPDIDEASFPLFTL